MANLYSFMRDRVFVQHQDPKGNWMACKRRHLLALGIEGLISSASYQNGKSVYLCPEDTVIFVQAYEAQLGKRLDSRVSHNQSTLAGPTHLRRYEPYKSLSAALELKTVEDEEGVIFFLDDAAE